MAAPAIIVEEDVTPASTPQSFLVGTNPQANATLVLIVQWSNIRTYTISDSHSDTWVQNTIEVSGDTENSMIAYSVGVTGGATTITITPSAGSNAVSEIRLFELTAGTAFDVLDTNLETSTTTSHFSAASGSIDSQANVICFSAGAFNSPGAKTAGSGWTEDLNTGQFIQQHISSVSALTDQRGDWTSSGSKTSAGIIAAFITPAAGGSILPQVTQSFLRVNR